MSVADAALRIAVLGGLGFIGKHFVEACIADPAVEAVRLLVHESEPAISPGPKVTLVSGDFATGDGLEVLMAPDWVVVNFVWLPQSGLELNVLAARRLAEVAQAGGVARLVHCSTAVVAGAVAENPVTEETPCQPVSAYQATKLAVEQTLLETVNDIELVIVRPTAVFGDGGRNLQKMMGDLGRRSRAVNWLHASIAGRRTLNLVPVETVLAALRVLLPAGAPQGIFNVACDENPANAYRPVETILRDELGLKAWRIPPPDLPLVLFDIFLRVLRRRSMPADRVYSSRRLRASDFQEPVKLEQALRAVARGFRQSKGR